MNYRLYGVLIGLLAIMGGCGSPDSSGSGADPTAVPMPQSATITSGESMTLNTTPYHPVQSNDGVVVDIMRITEPLTVSVGQTLFIAPPPSFTIHDQWVITYDATYLQADKTFQARDAKTWIWTAQKLGQTSIDFQNDPPCDPNQQCFPSIHAHVTIHIIE